MKQPNTTYYLFDKDGNLIGDFLGCKSLFTYLGVKKFNITEYVNKKIMLSKKWYISKSLEFEVPGEKCYLFSSDGKLLKEFRKLVDLANYLGIDANTVTTYLQLEKIYKKTYYFSKDIDFKPLVDLKSPFKKGAHVSTIKVDLKSYFREEYKTRL